MLDNLLKELKNQSWMKTLLYKSRGVYVVGGSVRDAFLKKPLKDVDLVVEGMTIEEVEHILEVFGKINIVGESFVVIKFRPFRHVGEDFDIAVCRKDRKTGSGHKDFSVETKNVTILEDLKRRDFTVNSIAVKVDTGEVLDPFNGRIDLKNKILRATDETAFSDDALRIVRAIQFAARFKFGVNCTTLKLMKDNAHLLNHISGERILDEFNKILLKGGSTKTAFELIQKTDIDKALFGRKMISVDFSDFEKLDMVSFYYTLGVLGGVTPSKFYRDKLKGEYHVHKAIVTIEKYFDVFTDVVAGKTKSELEYKWNVFQMLKTAPSLKDARVLPPIAQEIIYQMKTEKIPIQYGDIPVKGTDIMDKFGIPEGPELGNILNKMYQDALMNKFDWKNKTKTLKYLENI